MYRLTAHAAVMCYKARQYFPSFYYKKERDNMNEELRLVRIGYPLSEAVGIVYQKRKDGDLEKFICEKEREYAEDCGLCAKEVIG